MSTLQTLDRGIQALFIVAARGGLSVPELAAELGVPRANAYRIASTLIGHGLLQRSVDGSLRLGAALPALASRYWPGFLSTAQPILQSLADRAGATGFVTVAEGSECVVLATTEPATPILRVGYRAGSRHPLTIGAAGIAILAARVPTMNDAPEVLDARRAGYSVTRGQLQPGAVGVACAIPRNDGSFTVEASIGIVAMDGFDVDAAVPLVLEAARSLTEATASAQ